MLHSRPHIEAGDLVIMYLTRDSMAPVTITPGEHFHNKFGRYAHDDMIGMTFGTKMYSPKPHPGYVYLLRPSPELWTLSLPHRTQILYHPDISYIIQRLGVRPGARAVEAGTGSGSMTHSLSRAVGQRGKVFSFEYHQSRFEAAKKEFEAHSLDNVTIAHRNVCKDGFGGATEVDAIFLDLPAPWEAIPDTVARFSRDSIGRICSFSPCLEQVLKTVSTLREHKFEDIATVEVLARTHELVPPPPQNAPPRFRDITAVVAALKEHEDRKQERRISQMKAAREKARELKEEKAARHNARNAEVENGVSAEQLNETDRSPGALKRKIGETEEGTQEEPASSSASKRAKTSENNEIGQHAEANGDEEAVQLAGKDTNQEAPATGMSDIVKGWTDPQTGIPNVVVTKPSPEMRGHTSYLTFALYYPETIREQLEAQNDVAPSGSQTPVPKQVETAIDKNRERGGSQGTEYGDETLDKVMGSLTEEDMMAIGA